MSDSVVVVNAPGTPSNVVISGTTTGPQGPTGPTGATGATGPAGANFTGYDYEIHVSQVDGNDTTGNGDILTPVASITKALTLVNSQRKTVIVHPGTYTESPSITTQYTTITGPGLIGGNIVVSGTISTNTGCTISGIKMTNLTVTTPTGTGNVNILNCEVSGTFTKTSNADYTVLRLCDLTAASITGAGLVAIFGGNPNFITINNASANVIVKSAITVAPVLTAGTLSLVDSVVGAAVTNAVTAAASSIITLANCQFLTSTLTNVAPVVLNGFYSILNCVFDKPNSTLVALSATGGSTNSIDYFQYINADKFITQGGTSSQFVKGDGTLASLSAGDVPTLNQSTTGNAATATALQTSRNINGQPFNGTADITVADATKAPLTGATFTGAITATDITDSTMATAGVVTNNSAGLFQSNTSLSTALGGTGATTAATARTNLEITTSIPPFVSSGWYKTQSPVNTSALSPGNNRLDYTAFYVGTTTTFQKIGCTFTAVTVAGNAIFGIYSDSNGIPGSKLYDSGQITVPINGAVAFITPTTFSQTLTPGWYWLATVAQGVTGTAWQTATTQSSSGLYQRTLSQPSGTYPGMVHGFAQSSVSGTSLPATATPVANVGALVVTFLQVA